LNANALLFAVAAITSLGRNAHTTFESVGNSIELPPEPRLDHKPGRVIAPVLPPGTRAVAVRVRWDNVAGGFAPLPLSHADVIWSTQKGKNDVVAKTLLENVLVVAVDMPLQNEMTAVVTLALTPQDATKVSVAQGTGSLTLVPRAFPNDNRSVEKKK
jgi:Flp pilus assembly protein CpaB